jgi:hypothetical protein
MLSLLRIPLRMTSWFHDEKVLFQPLFKNIRKHPAFQKGDFLATFYARVQGIGPQKRSLDPDLENCSSKSRS